MRTRRRRRWAARWLVCALLAGLATSCGERAPTTYTDPQLRIVSLSPAITQVLIEFGLHDAIVAVGSYDHVAPPNTPSLGSFNDPDLERLVTLAPTHVLATTGQTKLPERVRQLAGQGYFVLFEGDYPNRVDNGIRLIEQIGEAIGRASKADALAAEMRHQLQALAALTAQRDRPRSLMVFDTQHMRACGPNTVHDELLHLAGGANAAAQATVSAPVYDREALRALAPEVVFLLMPGESPLQNQGDPRIDPRIDPQLDPRLDPRIDPRLDPLRGLDLPAMENGRIYLLNDPAVLLPGPSMMTTAVSMAVALHPDLAEPIAEVLRASP